MKTIKANQTFADLGIDSIMGSQIRNMLQRNYGVILSAEEVVGLTFNCLQSLIQGNTPENQI